ncbi:amidohydrolase family protein [Nocardioides convexus]|uniref:amidohydrolase family protein n=1 Tax=Nocardioides convexus TaxID=2712224 RepID=UPI003100D1E0
MAAAIGVAHSLGAKVTAHCFGEDSLGPLLDAGIDCIEHGTGLTEAHIERMVAGGVALVPTVLQTAKFPGFASAGRDKFPSYADTMERLFARRREVLMQAQEAGVALYVGSDGGGSARHGVLHEEIRAMAEMGLPNEYVLGAASWRARAWLGWNPGLDEGDPADFVVYPRNPVEDLSVLRGARGRGAARTRLLLVVLALVRLPGGLQRVVRGAQDGAAVRRGDRQRGRDGVVDRRHHLRYVARGGSQRRGTPQQRGRDEVGSRPGTSAAWCVPPWRSWTRR